MQSIFHQSLQIKVILFLTKLRVKRIFRSLLMQAQLQQMLSRLCARNFLVHLGSMRVIRLIANTFDQLHYFHSFFLCCCFGQKVFENSSLSLSFGTNCACSISQIKVQAQKIFKRNWIIFAEIRKLSCSRTSLVDLPPNLAPSAEKILASSSNRVLLQFSPYNARFFSGHEHRPE